MNRRLDLPTTPPDTAHRVAATTPTKAKKNKRMRTEKKTLKYIRAHTYVYAHTHTQYSSRTNTTHPYTQKKPTPLRCNSLYAIWCDGKLHACLSFINELCMGGWVFYILLGDLAYRVICAFSLYTTTTTTAPKSTTNKRRARETCSRQSPLLRVYMDAMVRMKKIENYK